MTEFSDIARSDDCRSASSIRRKYEEQCVYKLVTVFVVLFNFNSVDSVEQNKYFFHLNMFNFNREESIEQNK